MKPRQHRQHRFRHEKLDEFETITLAQALIIGGYAQEALPMLANSTPDTALGHLHSWARMLAGEDKQVLQELCQDQPSNTFLKHLQACLLAVSGNSTAALLILHPSKSLHFAFLIIESLANHNNGAHALAILQVIFLFDKNNARALALHKSIVVQSLQLPEDDFEF